MKVLGINTSPREESNVKIAMENALAEVQAKKADTKIISVNKLDIKPCQGDNYCKEHDAQCAIQDHMQNIYNEIEKADVIVIGSPIYFSNFAAQAKIIIDRMYAYFMNEKYQKAFNNKKIALITSNGGAPVEAFMPILEAQMNYFEILGFKKGDILTLSGNTEPGAINDKEDQLEQAREFGRNLI